MPYSAVFLVILILVSGFIAYWGDLLGRRMGKRRLTLFGLRPKHTAIIMTTITGMVIAALTLATMLTVDRHLRDLLVRGDQIISDNIGLNKKNRNLRKDLRNLNERQYKMTERLRGMLAEVRSAISAERKANLKQALAEEKAIRLSSEVDRRSKELAELELRYKRTNRQLAEGEKRLAITTRDLRETDRLYAEARETRDRFGVGYGRMITGSIIARQPEEIIRGVIHPSKYARRDLENLLGRASEIMIRKGAVKGRNGRGVAIAPIRLIKPRDSKGRKNEVRFTESDSINACAKAITESPVDVVVLVVAARNCVNGEQAQVDLMLRNNKVAFRKGENIASAKLDGAASAAKIYGDLVRFLQTDVRIAARRAGVIPVYDPDDPQAMFGTITGPQFDEFMDVVNRIKATNDQVTVRIVAQEDINVSGPMNLGNLDFVIAGSSARASRLD